MWPRRAPAGRERQRTVAAGRPASLSRVTPINGLALCKLHHAAFDANIIGVTPDLEVTVRLDVLQEIDGPMLQHGLQGSGDPGRALRPLPPRELTGCILAWTLTRKTLAA